MDSRVLEPPERFEDNVRRALAMWHRSESYVSPLADLAAVKQMQATGNTTIRRATNDVLSTALVTLAKEYPKDAALLRRRYVDRVPVFLVASELNVAEATLYKMQRTAVARLAEVVYRLEAEVQTSQQYAVGSRLPPATYSKLIGVESSLGHLSKILTSTEPPLLVSVEGLGGIGKTALAHQLADRLVLRDRSFVGLAWVSAQRQVFNVSGHLVSADDAPLTANSVLEKLADQLLETGFSTLTSSDQMLLALRTRLSRGPHLIVIDNLETAEDVESLLPLLRRLAGPAKILLTSRTAYHAEPGLYHFSLPELPEEEALGLVRYEGRLKNLPEIVSADDAELRPIVDTVGGNPLALKLVVGQLIVQPLPVVLDNLRQARRKKTEELYRFIYWNSWSQLSPDERKVLMVMPLYAHTGADLEGVAEVSGVTGDSLLESLAHLTSLSLVNVSGNLAQRRYGIHQLTESFLISEVIKWHPWSAAERN